MLKVDARATALEHISDDRRRRSRNSKLSAAADRIVAKAAEPTMSPQVIVGIAQLIEGAWLFVTGIICVTLSGSAGYLGYTLSVLVGATLLFSLLGSAAQTHQISAYRTLGKQVLRSFGAWSLVFVLVAFSALAFKAIEQLQGGWIGYWYIAGAGTIVAGRLILRLLVRNWTANGRLKSRTVIVGGGEDAKSLVELIGEQSQSEIELLGIFDDRLDARSPSVVSGCPKLGSVTDLIEFARQTRIDLVIVSMPLSAEKRVLEMLKKLWVLPVDIRLSAHMSQLRFTPKAYSYVGAVPVFDMADRPITDWNLVFKRLFDLVVAIITLTVLSPLILFVTIAIKLDSKGPIFFKQRRHGFNNEFIDIYKFRTMFTDLSDLSAAKLVTKGDPRVTRVGRILRKTSIDELPQLLNVFRGELSVIGPRPHALQAKAANRLYHEAVDGYFARHKVKPGITGWAQINGWRGETDTLDKIMQRVNHDLYYIENWSLLLDLYILIRTPSSLIKNAENAY